MPKIEFKLPVDWFYYIAPIDNVRSILKNGILSYNQAKNLSHVSLAMKDVQQRRSNKMIIPGLGVHDCVNLYLNPRNTTLYKLMVNDKLDEIAILVVSTDVLNSGKRAFFSTGNAASKDVKFFEESKALYNLQWDIIMGDSWQSDDTEEMRVRRSIMCAELLISEKVAPEYIRKILVPRHSSRIKLQKLQVQLPIEIDMYTFFDNAVAPNGKELQLSIEEVKSINNRKFMAKAREGLSQEDWDRAWDRAWKSK